MSFQHLLQWSAPRRSQCSVESAQTGTPVVTCAITHSDSPHISLRCKIQTLPILNPAVYLLLKECTLDMRVTHVHINSNAKSSECLLSVQLYKRTYCHKFWGITFHLAAGIQNHANCNNVKKWQYYILSVCLYKYGCGWVYSSVCVHILANPTKHVWLICSITYILNDVHVLTSYWL